MTSYDDTECEIWVENGFTFRGTTCRMEVWYQPSSRHECKRAKNSPRRMTTSRDSLALPLGAVKRIKLTRLDRLGPSRHRTESMNCPDLIDTGNARLYNAPAVQSLPISHCDLDSYALPGLAFACKPSHCRQEDMPDALCCVTS